MAGLVLGEDLELCSRSNGTDHFVWEGNDWFAGTELNPLRMEAYPLADWSLEGTALFPGWDCARCRRTNGLQAFGDRAWSGWTHDRLRSGSGGCCLPGAQSAGK